MNTVGQVAGPLHTVPTELINEEIKYYNLEAYLFADVHDRFHKEGKLSAFDFFCIVIWKANRAKSKVAAKLLKHSYTTLDEAVGALTSGIFKAESHKERLRLLLEDWGFYLPMATAVLTVLYPEDFTVFDIRVCEILPRFSELKNKTSFTSIWPLYTQYVEAVRQEGKGKLSLRDCDRLLWGLSFANQLRADIENSFKKPEPEDEEP